MRTSPSKAHMAYSNQLKVCIKVLVRKVIEVEPMISRCKRKTKKMKIKKRKKVTVLFFPLMWTLSRYKKWWNSCYSESKQGTSNR